MKTSKTVNLTSSSLAGATSFSSALTFSIKRSDSCNLILLIKFFYKSLR